MKRFSLLVMAGAALMACSREMREETYTMTVVAEAPSTKTVVADDGLGGYAVSWQADDRMALYEAPFAGEPSLVTSEELGAAGISSGNFVFQLTGTPTGPFYYQFVYPASAMKKVGSELTATIPSAQTFAANSFDPQADVLVSHPLQINQRVNSVAASLARLGGTARMTIQAPSTDETTQKVIFSTTGTDVYIAGAYNLNTLELLSDARSQVITLTPSATTAYSGAFDVWFRLAQVTFTDNFTVSVVTDKKTYTKTLYLSTLGRSLEFRDSKLTTFSVDMTTVPGVENAMTDIIDAAYTGVPNFYYASWTLSGSQTGAVYSGNSSTQDSGMGFRKNNNNSGVVSTASGGKLKSVTLSVYSDHDTYTRTMDVYAKTTPYSSPADLFATETQGDYIGSVTTPAKTVTTQTIDVPDGYSYVGIRSNDYTTYVPEIRIAWEGAPRPRVTTGESADITSTGATLHGTYVSAPGGIYEAGFYYGTSADNLSGCVTVDGTSAVTGSFSGQLGSLSELTRYYYKAYILWLNTQTNTYEEFTGEVKSFDTIAHDYSAAGWLELPSYTVADMAGTTTSTLGDLYFVTHKAQEQRNYSLLYDPEMWMAYWVAYPLCKDHLGSGRDDQWGVWDPKVPAGKQVNLSKGYGVSEGENYYARGHQIPNADRNGNPDMQEQTYYPTNITPQLQNGFNAGIWLDLESAVRTAVHDGDTVYVVTGAAFRKAGGSEDIKIIQPNNSIYSASTIDIPVPNYYWKVLLKVKRNGDSINNASAVGFWLPHDDSLRYNTSAYMDYAVSVDQIEQWTGFNFFANLPEALQDYCESKTDWDSFQVF